jgi:hypothetical protein
MVHFTCDGCGKKMGPDDLRYEVTIDVRAARNEIVINLADLVRDHRAEMIELIKRMEHDAPEDLEDQVYKKMNLDLCPTCQRAYLKDPIHFHPERSGPPPEVDIDAFLRGLGQDGASDQE